MRDSRYSSIFLREYPVKMDLGNKVQLLVETPIFAWGIADVKAVHSVSKMPFYKECRRTIYGKVPNGHLGGGSVFYESDLHSSTEQSDGIPCVWRRNNYTAVATIDTLLLDDL